VNYVREQEPFPYSDRCNQSKTNLNPKPKPANKVRNLNPEPKQVKSVRTQVPNPFLTQPSPKQESFNSQLKQPPMSLEQKKLKKRLKKSPKRPPPQEGRAGRPLMGVV
jgi:hypothetical protein